LILFIEGMKIGRKNRALLNWPDFEEIRRDAPIPADAEIQRDSSDTIHHCRRISCRGVVGDLRLLTHDPSRSYNAA
jgi:hypothetical protein